MKNITIAILSALFISLSLVSCTTEEVWEPEAKSQAYFNALYLVNREVIYNLDYLFESSILIDALQNDGDVDKIMSRYFSSNSSTRVDYSEKDNHIIIICGHESDWFKKLDIATGGKLLTVEGAQWTVNGTYRRVWESEMQPEQESFSFDVVNMGDKFSMIGTQVSNAVGQYYFTFSDIDLVFTTKSVIIHDEASGDGNPDDRPMNQYILNGKITTTTPDEKDGIPYVPKYRSTTLANVKGGNPYEYYLGEPIFIGQFFTSGKQSGTFGQSKGVESFEVDYNTYKAILDGTTYSL